MNVWSENSLVAYSDTLAREEPLEIQLNGNPLTVTMRTPGNDLDLTAGFLLTEGLITGREALVSLRQARNDTGQPNRVQAESADEVSAPQRNFLSTSSCGVCGEESGLHDLR